MILFDAIDMKNELNVILTHKREVWSDREVMDDDLDVKMSHHQILQIATVPRPAQQIWF